jgi:LemA protein
MAVLICVAVVVLLAVWGVLSYNEIVRLSKQTDAGWSHIRVQLQRRHDMVPNLVETVKGYAAHEKETLDAVITARNAAASAVDDKQTGRAAQAEGVLTGTLSKLFALKEAYPELKANVNFLKLQEEIASTEDRVAYARQFYNDVSTKFNTKIATFPGMLIKGIGSFKERELFEAEEGAAVAPVVKF